MSILKRYRRWKYESRAWHKPFFWSMPAPSALILEGIFRFVHQLEVSLTIARWAHQSQMDLSPAAVLARTDSLYDQNTAGDYSYVREEMMGDERVRDFWRDMDKRYGF